MKKMIDWLLKHYRFFVKTVGVWVVIWLFPISSDSYGEAIRSIFACLTAAFLVQYLADKLPPRKRKLPFTAESRIEDDVKVGMVTSWTLTPRKPLRCILDRHPGNKIKSSYMLGSGLVKYQCHNCGKLTGERYYDDLTDMERHSIDSKYQGWTAEFMGYDDNPEY